MLRSRVARASAATLVAAAALSLAPAASPSLAAQTTAQAKPAPEIYLRAPQNGAVVPSTFPVEFGLRNYGVAPVGVNLNGTGHFHILINVDAPAVGTVIPADSLHRHFGGGQIETTLTLAPGTYTLRAVLADHEHKVISRELVSGPVRVTVRGAR
jgi:hypothetical protein